MTKKIQHVRLIKLEVGYESTHHDTCEGDKPAVQLWLENLIPAEFWWSWTAPGYLASNTDLTGKKVCGDDDDTATDQDCKDTSDASDPSAVQDPPTYIFDDDEWVGAFIQQELNAALGHCLAKGKQLCITKEEHLRVSFPLGELQKLIDKFKTSGDREVLDKLTTGKPGTDCKGGKEWENARTYDIPLEESLAVEHKRMLRMIRGLDPDDPCDKPTDGLRFFATLNWVCRPHVPTT